MTENHHIKREDKEPPFAISKKSMRFHHIGIPTKDIKPNEKYLQEYKMFVSRFNKVKKMILIK